MRLAVLTSHPVQYYAPLFRELTKRADIHVFYAHKATPEEQAAAGFGEAFDWDVDLTSGYEHSFLNNVAKQPNASRFNGCDTPEIGAKLRAGWFDAVLTLGWHLKSLLQGVWAAKRLGLPVLVRGDSHLDTPRSTAKRMGKELAYPPFLRMFDAALYVGARNLAYYRHYRYPADRLVFSPHCVDTDRFSQASTPDVAAAFRGRLGVPTSEVLVLFAGKLVEFKRPLDVVEAVGRIRRGGMSASLMVAGSGPLEAELKARGATLNVPLYCLGFQNQLVMPAVYAASNVLALPSNGRETWGLVCNEALACGTPVVVSSEVGCAPDLAADGQAGQVFRVGDIGALSAALGSVLHQPPALCAIRSRSEQFSLSRAVDGIMEACGAAIVLDRLARENPPLAKSL